MADDFEPRYYLTNPNGLKIDLGIVNSVKFNFSDSLTKLNMPAQTSSHSFIYDTGNTLNITISGSRIMPLSVNDSATGDDRSLKWSNEKWLTEVRGVIDRYQLNTDGCKFGHNPRTDSEEDTYEYNCYLSRWSDSFSNKTPDAIEYTATLYVGQMSRKSSNVNNANVTKIDRDKMCITLSSPTSTSDSTVYTLMSGTDTKRNCIESYTLKGGMTQPFEYLTMKIPKKRLTSVAPALVDNIKAGSNLLTVNAYGKGEFIVTACKLSNDTYTITAYSVAEAFKGMVTSMEYSSNDSPMFIIRDILANGVTIGEYIKEYPSSKIIVGSKVKSSTTWSGDIKIPAGSNAWYVMQICAYRLGARIFFTEDVVYIVDPRDSADGSTLAKTYTENTNKKTAILLYDESLTSLREDMAGKVVYGNEGSQTVANVCTVSYVEPDDNGNYISKSIAVYADETKSAEKYGERKGSTLAIKEIRNFADAQAIGKNYLSYLIDSQNSIGFTVKETNIYNWTPTFDPYSRAQMIVDESNDAVTTNFSNCRSTWSGGCISVGVEAPNLLNLSTYQRNYPEGTSTYWWGIQSATDLTQSMSNIMGSLNN